MDSLANRQHSCRGSEELGIRKTARFQATPSYFAELRATPSYSELLRVGGAQELRATQSNSELLSAIRIGSLWGGCCQLPFCDSYRPVFETWVRIRYFESSSILRLRDGSSSDLRGSKKLAKALYGCPLAAQQLRNRLPAACKLFAAQRTPQEFRI